MKQIRCLSGFLIITAFLFYLLANSYAVNDLPHTYSYGEQEQPGRVLRRGGGGRGRGGRSWGGRSRGGRTSGGYWYSTSYSSNFRRRYTVHYYSYAGAACIATDHECIRLDPPSFNWIHLIFWIVCCPFCVCVCVVLDENSKSQFCCGCDSDMKRKRKTRKEKDDFASIFFSSSSSSFSSSSRHVKKNNKNETNGIRDWKIGKFT